MNGGAGDEVDDGGGPDDRALAALVDNHRAFLRFLERRTGRRDVAEDILQDAFVRSVGKAGALPDEAIVPWFYRVLRNALIDRMRRRDAEVRALESFAAELATADVARGELHQEICACVSRLARTLKPEYAAVLRAVDVDGIPVKAFAESAGVSASNAGVRLHRARRALRQRVSRSCGTCAEHGCLDCSCKSTLRP